MPIYPQPQESCETIAGHVFRPIKRDGKRMWVVTTANGWTCTIHERSGTFRVYGSGTIFERPNWDNAVHDLLRLLSDNRPQHSGEGTP